MERPDRQRRRTKGSSWTAQIRRLARPSWGLTPALAKRLFIGVATPRILYAFDVWGLPQVASRGRTAVGSAKAIRVFTSVQRAGALAITGRAQDVAHRTRSTQPQTSHPLPLTIERWCPPGYDKASNAPTRTTR
jgi:hypothetical protein